MNKEMTQAQLAEACGVSQGTVVFWEKGLSIPKADKIRPLATALGCDSDLLLQMASEHKKQRA